MIDCFAFALPMRALSFFRAKIAARYSASLFVTLPKYSPYFLRIFPLPSQMTTPRAAGPGFPRAPPSVYVMNALCSDIGLKIFGQACVKLFQILVLQSEAGRLSMPPVTLQQILAPLHGMHGMESRRRSHASQTSLFAILK